MESIVVFQTKVIIIIIDKLSSVVYGTNQQTSNKTEYKKLQIDERI